jgi:hypothetical protein
VSFLLFVHTDDGGAMIEEVRLRSVPTSHRWRRTVRHAGHALLHRRVHGQNVRLDIAQFRDEIVRAHQYLCT